MIKFWAGVTACLVGLCAGYGLASRNSSGTMAAINGPYTAGTVISSSVINARLADIETEITDSKSRSGKGDFSAPVRAADGVVTAPAFAFTSETGTGLYRIGSSDLGVAINQVKKLELTSSLFTVTPNASFSGVLLGANGAVGAPSYSFTNDATAGLYRAGSGDLRFSVAGADVTKWTAGVFSVSPTSSGSTPLAQSVGNFEKNGATGISIMSPNANSTSIWFGDATSGSRGGIDYFMSANANADQMRFNTNGAEHFRVNTAGVLVTGSLTVGASGNAATGINMGACTLNGGTPAQCTATVATNSRCAANVITTTPGNTRSLGVSVSTTTLTITSQTNGDVFSVNYVCVAN